MYFDDLAVTCSSETYAVVLDIQVGADCVEAFADFLSRLGIGIVKKANAELHTSRPA